MKTNKQTKSLKPIPKPTDINKSEGWAFDYGFVSDIAEECRKLDEDFAPSMEGVYDVLRVLKKRGHIVVA
jgi:hypothetical protein